MRSRRRWPVRRRNIHSLWSRMESVRPVDLCFLFERFSSCVLQRFAPEKNKCSSRVTGRAQASNVDEFGIFYWNVLSVASVDLARPLTIASWYQSIRYCSRGCQKLDWAEHRLMCKAWSEKAAEGGETTIAAPNTIGHNRDKLFDSRAITAKRSYGFLKGQIVRSVFVVGRWNTRRSVLLY